jgi:hypothetical protein
VKAISELDGEIDLFEYVLQKVVLRYLEPHFLPQQREVIQYYSIGPLARDCAVLLSAVAYAGSGGAAGTRGAFDRGAARLVPVLSHALPFLAMEECSLAHVDTALNRLAQAVPQIRKNVLTACVDTAASDGVLQEIEAELLRAIADRLGCPLPPLLAEGN